LRGQLCYRTPSNRPPFLYLLSRIRNILSQLSPSEISSNLSTNILAISISSPTPMMYLSLDSIKCLSNVDHTQNVYAKCSGVSSPQLFICMFLLIMMAVKVIIAPLSTTTLTANVHRQRSHQAQPPPPPHFPRRPLRPLLPAQLLSLCQYEGGGST